jgi:hypothetical protein
VIQEIALEGIVNVPVIMVAILRTIIGRTKRANDSLGNKAPLMDRKKKYWKNYTIVL